MKPRAHEGVVEALACLIEGSRPRLEGLVGAGVEIAAIDLAAKRTIMRLVAIALAEARGRLAIAGGLHELRDRLARESARSSGFDAWPRLLERLRAFAGELDELERADDRIDDARVLRLLESLAPADLATLPSESLGDFYEALHDHELRRSESGEWSWVGWAATRKGAGAFYTPPELAAATVRRTLQPLTHDRAPEGGWRAKPADVILSARICDPAMGSGAFLLAAARWLGDALDESARLQGGPSRRAEVIERCLYGVDLDPLAVELARAALWIEMGGSAAGFDALAERLKCGNALVGRGPDDPPSADEVDAPHRCFHWPLEFPEVFESPRAGFDAVIGNPPWDVQKPNSKHFFAKYDPGYPALGKQAALRWQAEAFARSPALEREWKAHRAGFEALANWVRARFHHQGSADLNSYKLFVERGHALLREGGRLGLIVPSGLYTDKGSAALRELLLDRCNWEWLFAFENRDEIFAIHRSFKFAAIVVEKGGRTDAIQAGFMRRDLAEWSAEAPRTLAYPRAQILRFSPESKAIVELDHARDLALLERLYVQGVRLGDRGPEGWGIESSSEFHMTSDSGSFAPCSTWAEAGYRPDEFGHWLAGGWRPYTGPSGSLERPRGLILARDGQHAIDLADIEGVALPLAQGAMIHQFDCWAAGHGAGGWEAQTWPNKQHAAQYLVAASEYARRDKVRRGSKFAIRMIARATDARTIIGALIPDLPCGNALGLLGSRDPLGLAAAMNSWPVDWAARQRLGGTNVNAYIAQELPLPRPWSQQGYPRVAASNCANRSFAPLWLELADSLDRPWTHHWALTRHERLRLRVVLDALVAKQFGLSVDDLAWILAGCDLPLGRVGRVDAAPRGFWRVDKDQPPELRHSVLTLVAYRELERIGLDAFLAMDEGRGWTLPPTLRLADYGLGHDDRAREHQAVAAVLGPRWLAGQLDGEFAASWEACARDAELIAAIAALG